MRQSKKNITKNVPGIWNTIECFSSYWNPSVRTRNTDHGLFQYTFFGKP